jgi:hypothetical protein
MAVPKRKTSHMKTKRKYQTNNNKQILNRTLLLNEFDIYNKMYNNEFAMPYYLINNFSKKKRIR